MERKMGKETLTMDVIVHKANIALQNGESLHDFSNSLSNAAKGHALQQLNIVDGKGGAWMVEAYSDRVVLEVWQEGKTPRYMYQQMGYVRDKDGNFTFNNMIEVKRVTTFKPTKDAISVTKAAEQDFWVPVQKSLFEGAV
jgi:uncharacterized protein with LGFP repeats